MGGDRDMTGQDPMSSTAEGDDDLGTAALAEDTPDAGTAGESASTAVRPPPEADDDTPVTDASPEHDLGYPEG